VTLLEEFIFSLNRSERAKLRPLQFRGAKREIFMKILNCREAEGIDQQKVLARLKLSKKRFYQIIAEMLHALYGDVAPSGGAELLQYLGNMQLYRHFYRAMKQQEALLKKKNDRNALADFYFSALIMSEFFLIPPHLAGHIRAEFRKYLRSYVKIKTKHSGDELLLRCAEIEEEIHKNFSSNFSLKKLKTEMGELEKLFQQAKQKDQLLAQFKIAYLLATTCFRNLIEGKRPEQYLEYINRTIADHPDIFGRTVELVRLGIESYIPPKSEDIEKYKTFLLHPPPDRRKFIVAFYRTVSSISRSIWLHRFGEKNNRRPIPDKS